MNVVLVGIVTFLLAAGLFLFAPLGQALATYFLYPWLASALIAVLLACLIHLYRRWRSPIKPDGLANQVLNFLDELDHRVLPGWSLWTAMSASFVVLVVLLAAPKCIDPQELHVSFELVTTVNPPLPILRSGAISLPAGGGEVVATVSRSNPAGPAPELGCEWTWTRDGQPVLSAGCSVLLQPGRDSVPDTLELYLAKPGCPKIGPYSFFINPP